MSRIPLERMYRWSVATIFLWLKRAVFWAVLLASGWAVYKLFVVSILRGQNEIFGFIAIWAITAYIIIPRVNRLLTRWYVPEYFIGRVRTSDGMLSDPVNVAFCGNKKDLQHAMREAGWHEADRTGWGSSLKIIKNTILRQSYPNAPVSAKFLFGRKHDFAYQQEVDGHPARRHHVRFWKCPPGWRLPGGHKVQWLAAGTYDRSVGFSAYNLQVTHKIAENTDEERDHIVATLQKSGAVRHVEIIKHFSTGYHDKAGGGDTIKTDGSLPIVTL